MIVNNAGDQAGNLLHKLISQPARIYQNLRFEDQQFSSYSKWRIQNDVVIWRCTVKTAELTFRTRL